MTTFAGFLLVTLGMTFGWVLRSMIRKHTPGSLNECPGCGSEYECIDCGRCTVCQDKCPHCLHRLEERGVA